MTMASVLQATFVILAATIAIYYSGKGNLLLRKATELVHGKPGCAPVPDVGNVTIHYFAGRGRAEAMRMLLEVASVPYSEMAFTSDTWPAHKVKGTQSGLYTFSQVPAIETSSGVRLVQSHVILHYLGRATGMECDCEDVHWCDLLAHGAEDAKSKLSKLLYDPGFSLKDREEYLTNVMPMWLGYFEKLAPPLTEQESPFFASGRLTWVDFLVFDLIETDLEFAKFDFRTPGLVQVNVLEKLPRLSNFYRSMAKLPRLAKHLSSKSRYPFKVPYWPSDAASKPT